jgi:hypothetical protein
VIIPRHHAFFLAEGGIVPGDNAGGVFADATSRGDAVAKKFLYGHKNFHSSINVSVLYSRRFAAGESLGPFFRRFAVGESFFLVWLDNIKVGGKMGDICYVYLPTVQYTRIFGENLRIIL